MTTPSPPARTIDASMAILRPFRSASVISLTAPGQFSLISRVRFLILRAARAVGCVGTAAVSAAGGGRDGGRGAVADAKAPAAVGRPHGGHEPHGGSGRVQAARSEAGCGRCKSQEHSAGVDGAGGLGPPQERGCPRPRWRGSPTSRAVSASVTTTRIETDTLDVGLDANCTPHATSLQPRPAKRASAAATTAVPQIRVATVRAAARRGEPQPRSSEVVCKLRTVDEEVDLQARAAGARCGVRCGARV